MLKVNYPETPAGKRSIRKNEWGNWYGYVSGRRFWEFGTDNKSAVHWSNGATLEDAYVKCWIEPQNTITPGGRNGEDAP